jgi:hypothetical protein
MPASRGLFFALRTAADLPPICRRSAADLPPITPPSRRAESPKYGAIRPLLRQSPGARNRRLITAHCACMRLLADSGIGRVRFRRRPPAMQQHIA